MIHPSHGTGSAGTGSLAGRKKMLRDSWGGAAGNFVSPVFYITDRYYSIPILHEACVLPTAENRVEGEKRGWQLDFAEVLGLPKCDVFTRSPLAPCPYKA